MKVYGGSSFLRPNPLEAVSQVLGEWHLVKYVRGPDVSALRGLRQPPEKSSPRWLP